MEPAARDNSPDRCPRCLEQVPARAARCPGCGERMPHIRRVRLVMAVAGAILGLAILAGLLFAVIRFGGDSTPAPEPARSSKQPPLN
jgi:hypothetical protein